MADDADRASRDTEELEEREIAWIRQKALNIPEGKAGECERCEEESPRLVQGVCARCRDKYKLP